MAPPLLVSPTDSGSNIFARTGVTCYSCSIFEKVKSCDIQTFSAKMRSHLEVLELARIGNFCLAATTPNRLWFS